MFTVDLFSVNLPSRVDIVIRYIEVDFTFGPLDYVRFIEEFVISLNRGSLNRGSIESKFFTKKKLKESKNVKS